MAIAGSVENKNVSLYSVLSLPIDGDKFVNDGQRKPVF
jgi:hypothetical protein